MHNCCYLFIFLKNNIYDFKHHTHIAKKTDGRIIRSERRTTLDSMMWLPRDWNSTHGSSRIYILNINTPCVFQGELDITISNMLTSTRLAYDGECGIIIIFLVFLRIELLTELQCIMWLLAALIANFQIRKVESSAEVINIFIFFWIVYEQ